MYMVTIKVNERTKAGKALIETARLMAQKFSGIDILEENNVLASKIKMNRQNDLLSDSEKDDFIKELHNLAE